jgi:hypothetical protein
MLDLIFEVQLMKTLEEKRYFPKVTEEIIVVNEEVKNVLNYVAIVEVPKFSLINMLEGPMGALLKDADAEDGYHS